MNWQTALLGALGIAGLATAAYAASAAGNTPTPAPVKPKLVVPKAPGDVGYVVGAPGSPCSAYYECLSNSCVNGICQ